MYYSVNPCYPAYDPCCCPDPYGGAIWYVPVPYPSTPGCCVSYPMSIPHELGADTQHSPAEALVGGKCDARLSLEYLVEAGAPAPKVTLTITSDGMTSTWTDTGIAVGYHVKEGFTSVKPGSKVKLEVTDAMARLRWCETICC